MSRKKKIKGGGKLAVGCYMFKFGVNGKDYPPWGKISGTGERISTNMKPKKRKGGKKLHETQGG